jgi:hypothetical protein
VEHPTAKYYYANKTSLFTMRSFYQKECKIRGIPPDASKFLMNGADRTSEIASSEKQAGIKPLKKFRGFNSRMSIDMTEHSKEQIYTKLYEKYPLQYYQEKARSLNLDAEPVENIKFEPSLKIQDIKKRNGPIRPCVQKIGIRASNGICSKTSLKKQIKLSKSKGKVVATPEGR